MKPCSAYEAQAQLFKYSYDSGQSIVAVLIPGTSSYQHALLLQHRMRSVPEPSWRPTWTGDTFSLACMRVVEAGCVGEGVATETCQKRIPGI